MNNYLPCENDKVSIIDIKTAPYLDIVRIAVGFILRYNMDTMGFVPSASNENSFSFGFSYAFTHFVVTNITPPLNKTETAAHLLKIN